MIGDHIPSSIERGAYDPLVNRGPYLMMISANLRPPPRDHPSSQLNLLTPRMIDLDRHAVAAAVLAAQAEGTQLKAAQLPEERRVRTMQARRFITWLSTLATCLTLGAVVPAATVTAAEHAEPPMVLPPPGSGFSNGAHAAASARDATWLVGARPSAAARRLAQTHGARRIKIGVAYRVSAHGARAFARDLRRIGALTYAEPDRRFTFSSAYEGAPNDWARGPVVSPELVPPPPAGAALGVVDQFIDPSHPDVGPLTTYLNTGVVSGPHGTMVASAAAGAVNGVGVLGIYPGVRVLGFGLDEPTCAGASDGIEAASSSGARVINLSFGHSPPCFTEYVAVQRAYARGTLVVAAAGNEFVEGNPVIYPAAFPHVLSVAALDRSLNAAYFSNENLAMDVAAPGVGVPVAIPVAFDDDGVPDGVTQADGTSFSSPIVAGAATWLATARPQLSNGQIADILRRSARDVGRPGYDSGTGFGLIRVAGALVFPTPRHDPLEPNDDIAFVDGTAFGRPDPYVWRGIGQRRISASADQIEDPVDVYRVQIPRRAAFKVAVHPNFGDPDLTVFTSRARTTISRRNVIARSRRPSGRSDVVRIVNNTAIARTAYVVVEVTGEQLSSAYRIEFARERRR